MKDYSWDKIDSGNPKTDTIVVFMDKTCNWIKTCGMKEKECYTLCDVDKCPIKELCGRYLPDMDKLKTVHFSHPPYNHEKQKCTFYVKFEIDTFHHDDIISDFDEWEW